MSTVFALLLIAAAYGLGRIHQFTRDAHTALGGGNPEHCRTCGRRHP